MGVFFDWLIGKEEIEREAMRKERIEKLTKESDPAKVEVLVKEIETIDAKVVELSK